MKRSREVGDQSNTSPRAHSPANTRPLADQNAHHHNSQLSLGRNSLKKTEQSPCKRSPMNEIDGNVMLLEDIYNYHQYTIKFVESEMAGVNENDLMEPSLHKYVTMKNAVVTSEME
ncbi:hypothetical protein ACLOJK_007789 [Asimina triloba]